MHTSYTYTLQKKCKMHISRITYKINSNSLVNKKDFGY